jgi:asparagine synthase (glutamine-hydrolysing)
LNVPPAGPAHPDPARVATVLNPIELGTGIVFGGSPQPLPTDVTLRPPEALEAAVEPAVRTGRCFVSFSGGRDSSAVLAAATAVARRESLPLPIPITLRADDVPTTHESDFQESVVRHLGLTDWVRLEIRDELDAVGPYARRAMARHGLLWPFNAHFHAPMLEQAEGGTLLTGVGGDELWFSSFAHTIGPRRRLLQLAPVPLRRAALTRRVPIDYPWLTPRGRRRARLVAAADTVTTFRSPRERMADTRGGRGIHTGVASLGKLADDAGASICHPLLDAQLWAAVAAVAPERGFLRGNDALSLVAGHLLPKELVSRRTKASFEAVFFHDHSRALAREWSGRGVPEDVVDVPGLRDHWLGEAPDSHSLLLMQSAWLASAGDRVEQARSCVSQ